MTIADFMNHSLEMLDELDLTAQGSSTTLIADGRRKKESDYSEIRDAGIFRYTEIAGIISIADCFITLTAPAGDNGDGTGGTISLYCGDGAVNTQLNVTPTLREIARVNIPANAPRGKILMFSVIPPVVESTGEEFTVQALTKKEANIKDISFGEDDPIVAKVLNAGQAGKAKITLGIHLSAKQYQENNNGILGM